MEFSVTTDFLNENSVEKGLMTLIEEDRQQELIQKLVSDGADDVKKQCGGSAANTVIAVSQFGGKSFYSCKVANDEIGKFYLSDLGSNGVDTNLTADTCEDGKTGTCLVMVTPDADRTMNTFLGITGSYSEAQIDYDALKESKWLYVEGYLVTGPTGQDAAMKALDFARKNNIKTAITMSDPNMVKFFKENFDNLLGSGVDLLFCNEDEAIEYTGKDNYKDAREELKKIAKSFVMTLGKKGATVWDGERFIDVDAHVVDAIDSNGAGDMFAGAYLYGITGGLSPEVSANLSSLSCSKLVSQFGPRLETSQILEIKKQLLS
jgi:sugar/nucleoside kinase (ribokinase family)